jgi:hypothetical protein
MEGIDPLGSTNDLLQMTYGLVNLLKSTHPPRPIFYNFRDLGFYVGDPYVYFCIFHKVIISG